ncbi:MAG TPA: ATP-binding protein [Desulfuromonadaceae bacterium]
MALPALPKDFRASFRFKLFAIFTSLTAIVTTLFIFIFIFAEIREQRRLAADKTHLLASRLASAVRLPLYAENRDALRLLAEETARDPAVHAVVITTNDGRVLTDLRKPTDLSPDDLLTETVEVRSSSLGASPESAIGGASKDPEGALIGRVRVEHDTSELKRWISQFIWTSCLLAVAFWLTVSSASYLALRQTTRSFNTLMEGIQIMRHGNYDFRIAVEREDEPGRAAAAVNELAASLQERDRENQRLHEELLASVRMEVQEKKKLLMAKLIQTNRMTSLGLLASSMAHEINNPNGSIRLAGQYLGRAWKDAMPLLQQVAAEEGDFNLGGIPFSTARDTVGDCCATIDRSTDRIAHVVQDLRSYSLGERNEMYPGVDVNRAVTNAVAIIHAHGSHADASIGTDLSNLVPTIYGNYHQLEQVLVNLLMNAVQAMQRGKGEIFVRTWFDAGNDEVLISVHDQGSGIPPEHMERLRDPFFSTRIDKGGSGLGLFVTNFIVNQHKGSLEFESEPGAGTTVTVRLPVGAAAAQA